MRTQSIPASPSRPSSTLMKAVATGAAALAITVGGVVAASPASAQAGSRLCGYFFLDIGGQWRALAIEIPKGNTAVQKDICNAAQARIKSRFVLGTGNNVISFRRAECEDVAARVGYAGDPCLKMRRAETIPQVGARSIAVFDRFGIYFR